MNGEAWSLVSTDGQQKISGKTIEMAGPLTVTPVALTDGGIIAVDASQGNDFHVTLAGNRRLAKPLHPADRQIIRVDVAQPPAGGPFALTYDAAYDFGTTGEPSLSTAASAVDTLGFRYIASLGAWTFLGAALGF